MLNRRSLLSALGALPLVPLASSSGHAAEAVAHRLTVLHMNDFHARHEPVDAAALACKPDGGKPGCFGGAARLATALATERAAAEAAGRTVLLVDAGDQFQGSLYFTAWHGEVELAVMRVLKTEAMAVGNHEFDKGPATLAAFVRAAPFPVLSANIEAEDDPDLKGLIRSHALVVKDGLPIGLVAATTQEAMTGSSPGPHVRFADPGPALARAAAAARADGAKLVIALSHLGVGLDRALAGTLPGIDVVVGGHSHTLLSDSEPGAAGPAHLVVEGPAGRAIVVQAACYGRYIGRLDLDVAADGTLVAWGGDVRHVGLELAEEPRVAAIVASYSAKLGEVRRQVVGRATAPLTTDGCRIGECALGDLVADALLGSVQGADIAIMNAGGLRTGLPAGDVTLGDVLTMLPFGNAVATVKLKGDDVRAAIANGLTRPGGGGFPVIAGAKVVWNPTAAPAARLVSVEIGDAPLDPARIYTVVTNDFMRRGGDGYTMMRDHAIDAYDSGPGLDEVVSRAINDATPVSAKLDGRMTVGR